MKRRLLDENDLYLCSSFFIERAGRNERLIEISVERSVLVALQNDENDLKYVQGTEQCSFLKPRHAQVNFMYDILRLP